MKAGKYTIKELFQNKNISSIVIPEIQRDYVWGKDQIDGLLKSLVEDFKMFSDNSREVEIQIDEDQSIKNSMLEYYKSLKYSSSIGFIYAYNDKEYPDKYFLIDGQQRLTTIYLVLAIIASKDNEFKKVFKNIYFKNNSAFIEYRVRESSFLFLNNVIKHLLKFGVFNVKNENWYYSFYENDKTIKSIINNISFIEDYLSTHVNSILEFKNYLLDYVQFWYFDTNISEQGEELYVYMNARGEMMQSNENLKADLLNLLDSSEEKDNWGTKWELWQDIFWKIRGKHINADNVFNEFVYCIGGLENTKQEFNIVISKETNSFERPSYIQLFGCFEKGGMLVLEEHIEAFNFLLGDKIINYCKEVDLYFDWILRLREEIVDILNNNSTNWFIKLTDENRGTERNRMVLIWSVIEFLKKRDNIDLQLVLGLRVYYNRYHNYVRGVKTSLEDVRDLHKEGISSLFSLNLDIEEAEKASYIHRNLSSLDICSILSTIWQLEEHPTNLDGSNVGNINSSHLVNYRLDPTLKQLKLIKDKFYELIPLDEKGAEDFKNYYLIINSLLVYGKFWNPKRTNHYNNLDFNDERKLIRDLDSTNDKCFSNFFSKFIIFDGGLEEFADSIINEPDYNKDSVEVLDVLRWYSYHLKHKMWEEGFYISYGNYKYLKDDKYFPNFNQLVNTKGNFNGGKPRVLSKRIKKQ